MHINIISHFCPISHFHPSNRGWNMTRYLIVNEGFRRTLVEEHPTGHDLSLGKYCPHYFLHTSFFFNYLEETFTHGPWPNGNVFPPFGFSAGAINERLRLTYSSLFAAVPSQPPNLLSSSSSIYVLLISL